jgi:hypothetical protein
VLAVALFSATAGFAVPAPCDLSPYLPASKHEAAFEHALRLFIYARCYETLGWEKDKLALRDTGPWIAGWSYGTHPAVRIWYSPEAIAWMEKPEATRGTIPDNAIIVKEQHSPPASANNDVGSWTVMVRDNQAVWDGWYWAFYSAPGKDDPPPPPTPPAPEPGDTSYPDSMFGNYCVNCHASTTNPEVTYAASSNIHGRSMSYTVVNPSMSDPTVSTDLHPDAHEAKGADAAPAAPKLNTSTVTQFLAMMAPGVTPGSYDNFPGVRWDHVVAGARPHGPAQFLTSDQCLGCHDATQNMDMPPNMIYPASGNKRGTANAGNTYNLSPYGEWRNSLMGLAGRDPVFFAQLASERTLHDQNPELPVTIQNTCFRCHGAMGQRQLHLDSGGKTPFAAEMVMQWQQDEPYAKYGALAREGISCTVCHHIAPEGLGTPATFTGQFNVNKPNEIYGPYTDPLKLPMDHGLGMTPVAGPHLKSSALCGSCHAIKLPVLNAKGVQVGEEYEQTTYLEWLNSDFQNEVKPFGSTVQTCQACHMPGTFKMQGFDAQQLAFRIANIEDDTYADVENRAPDKDITMPIRDVYSRHTLVGMNVFVLEMFRQFAADLGVRTKDPMSGYWQGTQGLDLTQQSMVDLATNQTAAVEILSMTKNEKTLDVKVRVTNKAGHAFPSGVSFRRAFVEFEVLDAQKHPLWASGATNNFGVITDGVKGAMLPTEFLEQQQYQPHYEVITKQSQVQIYEELVKNPEGQFTTSFLALADKVKSNRLQPRGWKKYGPWAEETKPHGGAAKDPDYANGSGADTIVYSIPLADLKGTPAAVSATIFYQTIPPYYLRQRFTDSTMPDTYRLMEMTGSLKTGDTPFPHWKLRVTGATKPVE